MHLFYPRANLLANTAALDFGYNEISVQVREYLRQSGASVSKLFTILSDNDILQ
jgi:hypothetical protein